MGFFSNLFKLARGSGADKPAKRPKPGEASGPQTGSATANGGMAAWAEAIGAAALGKGAGGAGVKGFDPPKPGTFDVYRKIAEYPTVALGLQKIIGPICDSSVTWEKKDEDDTAADEYVTLLSDTFDGQLPDILELYGLSLRFGFTAMEKVWVENKDGKLVIDKLKPLLVDATEFVYDKGGKIVGIQNKPGNAEPIKLGWEKVCAFSYDSNLVAGNPYGRARLENLRARWCEVEQIIARFAKYLAKVAAVIGQIHYPDGQSKDAAGSDRPNAWLAAQIAADAAAGRWLLIPNKFASFLGSGEVTASVLEKALAAAGKSEWVVSFLEPGGTDFAPGFTAALEYYDKLLMRGLYLPERSVLEGEHGNKADAGKHDEMTVLDASGLFRKFITHFNQNVVDEVLVYNYGEQARGAVYAQPPPLTDDSGASRMAVLTALLNSTDPAVSRAAARKIDLTALLEDEEIPVVEGEEDSTLGDAIDEAQALEQKQAEQDNKAKADALKVKAQQPAAAEPKQLSRADDVAELLTRYCEGETHGGNGRVH